MSTPTVRKAGPREWAGLAVLALPTVLLGLDVTVLYLALPSLAEDLRPSSTEELWIMDAYGFLIAGFLITMGTLGDRVGRRKLLMIGAAAFGAVSMVAAYANSVDMLIAARAALGIAGATLMPSTLALISNMFADQRQRSLAIGVWATSFALGMALGPVVGGAMLAHFWWGSAFLLAVPVAIILLVAAPVLIPEYRAPQSGRFDLLSVALSLLTILPVVYAVKRVAKDGLGTPTIAATMIGLVAAVLFVRRQGNLASPLLDVRLFTNRTFSAALSVLLVGLVGVGGAMLLITQQLQLVEELSPVEAGLWMGPPALMMFLAAIGAPLVARRVPPGIVVASTLALSTLGYALLSQVDPTSGSTPIVIGFGLVYLGLGAIAALGTDLVVGAAPPQKAGSASAMSETVQELGLALGVATLGSLATAVYRDRIGDEIPAGTPPAVAKAAGDSLAGASSSGNQLPDGWLDQAKEAATSGLNVAMLVAAVSTLVLAFLSAVVLRHVGVIGGDEPTGDEAVPVVPAASKT
ncbi:MFS transporter [Streptomyces zagrosensis]|uniref:DHA2 family multidrug resistance protein-like MFS transporter n=1 Tax=Streptomyces zagrosensis TaxID=1042984 RepID=A0A7W9V255_9ACTN|nr:MFS transporter [Streptomyces zagrosensis]MBB5939900.1 DHA2 family multidrug resistance protein-like MFS transporter [Streptomyces zagrosensis]